MRTSAEAVPEPPLIDGAPTPEVFRAAVGHQVAVLDAQRSALLDARDHGAFDADVLANALEKLPALNGPVGRLSAFPAESIAWLRVVREEDEGRFADALRASEDCVVVWAPSETATLRLLPLSQIHAALDNGWGGDLPHTAVRPWGS